MRPEYSFFRSLMTDYGALRPMTQKHLLTYDGIAPRLQTLPQVAVLRQIADALWQRDDVIALGISGSFAHGTADSFSDIDLQCAVTSNSLKSWQASAVLNFLADVLLGVSTTQMGEHVTQHHSLLTDGTILDLIVRSADTAPFPDATVVLECRDSAYAKQLHSAKLADQPQPLLSEAESVRQVIVTFWINSQKHQKVLGRGLEMLAVIGLAYERNTLLRLWHIAVTGNDADFSRATIHPLTRMLKPIQQEFGTGAMQLIGAPARNFKEIAHDIQQNRDEVSRLGHDLAEKLSFVYPDTIERVVRTSWDTFRANK